MIKLIEIPRVIADPITSSDSSLQNVATCTSVEDTALERNVWVLLSRILERAFLRRHIQYDPLTNMPLAVPFNRKDAISGYTAVNACVVLS